MSDTRKYILEHSGFSHNSLGGVKLYYQGKQTDDLKPEMVYNKKNKIYEFYPGYYFTPDRRLAQAQAGADGNIVAVRLHLGEEVKGKPIRQEVERLLLHATKPNYVEQFGGIDEAISEYVGERDRAKSYFYLYQSNYRGDYEAFFKVMSSFGYSHATTEEFNRTSGDFVVVFDPYSFTVVDVEDVKV